MRKSKIIPVLLAVLFIYGDALAQKVFSEGKISYTINMDPAVGTGSSKTPDNGSFVIYLKNYKTRSEMNMGAYNYTIIANSRDSSAVTLITSGSNKYLLHMDKSDVDKANARYQGVVFQYVEGTKEIAGYTCKKALGKLKDGNTFTVYYSPDLLPDNRNYSRQFEGLKGFPLEYGMPMRNHLNMILTATDVQLAPVPASTFDIPATGYREISPGELHGM